MNSCVKLVRSLLICAIALILLASPAKAALVELTTNGDFSAGLAGWATSPSGLASWTAGPFGATAPLSGQAIAINPGGEYALYDESASGAAVLYQAFTVPIGSIGETLSFDYFWNNWYEVPLFSGFGTGINNGTLTTASPPNQHAQVDILAFPLPGGDPFTSTVLSQELLLMNSPAAGNPFVNFTTALAGLTPGQSYIIRFGGVNTEHFANFGVDNVSILADTGLGPSGVPEPSSMALMGLGMGIVGLIRCRRSKKTPVDFQAV